MFHHIARAFAELAEAFRVFGRDLETLVENKVDGHMDGVVDKVTDLEGDLADLTSTVERLEERLEEVETDIGYLEATVADMVVALEAKADLDAVDDRIREIISEATFTVTF